MWIIQLNWVSVLHIVEWVQEILLDYSQVQWLSLSLLSHFHTENCVCLLFALVVSCLSYTPNGFPFCTHQTGLPFVHTKRFSLLYTPNGFTFRTHQTVLPFVHTKRFSLLYAPNGLNFCTHQTVLTFVHTKRFSLSYAPNGFTFCTHKTVFPFVRTERF